MEPAAHTGLLSCQQQTALRATCARGRRGSTRAHTRDIPARCAPPRPRSDVPTCLDLPFWLQTPASRLPPRTANTCRKLQLHAASPPRCGATKTSSCTPPRRDANRIPHLPTHREAAAAGGVVRRPPAPCPGSLHHPRPLRPLPQRAFLGCLPLRRSKAPYLIWPFPPHPSFAPGLATHCLGMWWVRWAVWAEEWCPHLTAGRNLMGSVYY